MPPKQKQPYAPISSSSFLDLKATISKHETDFTKSRQLGQSSRATGSSVSSSSSKKLPVWAKQNKGLAARQARDQVQYEEDPSDGTRDPERIKSALERKAAIYDKIRRGKTGGLSDAQIDSLLVDFDRKNYDHPDLSSDEEGDSASDVDESKTVPDRIISQDAGDDEPGPSLPHDPLVEYTDEFGRTRMVPRSEVPRGAPFHDPTAHLPADPSLPSSASALPDDGPAPTNILYGDQTHFPIYAPDPAVLAARAASLAAAAAAPLVDHYDATRETTRQRGAGFYQFSGDEDERRRQMEALERERSETERKRREREVEGDRVRRERERERDERKRRVEEKRREVEERRRKRAKGVDGA
ncbi:hypothetical protein JCM1841_000839 [Sporobolomyces salmonicolor]